MAYDPFEEQDRYGNRLGQKPTTDPASGNPRPMGARAFMGNPHISSVSPEQATAAERAVAGVRASEAQHDPGPAAFATPAAPKSRQHLPKGSVRPAKERIETALNEFLEVSPRDLAAAGKLIGIERKPETPNRPKGESYGPRVVRGEKGVASAFREFGDTALREFVSDMKKDGQILAEYLGTGDTKATVINPVDTKTAETVEHGPEASFTADDGTRVQRGPGNTYTNVPGGLEGFRTPAPQDAAAPAQAPAAGPAAGPAAFRTPQTGQQAGVQGTGNPHYQPAGAHEIRGVDAEGRWRSWEAGSPSQGQAAARASGGEGGSVTTLPQNVNPFLSKYAMSGEREQAMARNDMQLRREGNAHLASDATEAEVARHRDFLEQKEASAKKLERSELERQLENVNLSTQGQSIGSLVGNRRKAAAIERQLKAFDTRETEAANREAESQTAAADRAADFMIEQFKAQQEGRQPKVGATLERVRSKLASQGYGSLSPEEQFLVTQDLRKDAVEALTEERALAGTEPGKEPTPITEADIEQRMKLMLGEMAQGGAQPYRGDAAPANHPAAQQGPDGLWYVPAQAGEPGARKLKNGSYVKAVTQ